jgi:hypothetical protein
MAFNRAYLTTSKFGSKGLLKGKKEITLEVEIPDGYFTLEADAEAPLYRFVWRDAFGYHLEPVDQPEGMIGPMANGVYAQIDSMVREKLAKAKGIEEYAVPELMKVHDRFETQEMYDMLSR